MAKNQEYELLEVLKNGEIKYYLKFKDGENKERIERVTCEIANEITVNFERAERRMQRWNERHIDKNEITEMMLYKLALEQGGDVEDKVYENIINEKLRCAISKLPEKQKRRLMLYFFDGLTYKEIAKIEGCSLMAIKYSIDFAIKNLKNRL